MSTTDVFTSTGTWTCPEYVTSVWARCWGGGGSGGGVSINPAAGSNAGGGAAGGAFAEKTAYPVTPGVVYTVTVAAVRTGSTGDGANGNDSWFDNNTTGVLAKGGEAGETNVFDGSLGGKGNGSTTGCIGDNKFAGGNGALGVPDDASGVGSGGGGAGSGAAGSNGSAGSGGGGGSAGGGQGGNGRTTAGAGNAGSAAGGGGGGAFGTPGSFTFAGGNGAAGRVELEYTPAYSPSGAGGIRAVADEFVDVTSAPTVIGGVTPVADDVFLLIGNADSLSPAVSDNGLWTWTSAGTAMTQVTDEVDGSYRDVREGTYAGVRVFVLAAAFQVGGTDLVSPPTSGFFITPGPSPVSVLRGVPGPESYVGVLPAVSGGGSCVVTHGLGSKFLLVAVAATATPFAFQKIGGSDWVIERTDLNSVTVKPPSAITAGAYELMLRRAV